jgi:hypothetical protein
MKKFYILILLTFVYSCGYTSLYKEIKKDLKVDIISVKGDLELNSYIKNNLKMISNKDSTNVHKISFITEYNKIVLAKDTAGNATDYNLDMSVEFIILSNSDEKIVFKENFKIKKNDDNFEQSNYEKDIKRNFSKIVQEKLILHLIGISDS